MLSLIVTFCVLAVVIIVAGTVLARCSDTLADATGMGRSLAGLILLAGATSLPEFSVGWSAVRIGAYDLTLGGVIGSSLLNLLILALMDLFTQAKGRMLSRLAAAHALSAIASIILTCVVIASILNGSDFVLCRLGLGSWGLLLAYLFCMRLIFIDQHYTAAMTDAPQPEAPLRWKRATMGYLIAASAIFLAGPPLASSAESIAAQTGMGQTFFGTVFVALITSLPEAVTTFAAIRLGTIDMAVGNILGSNAFNMAMLAGLDLATPVPLLSSVAQTHALTGTAAVLVTSVVIAGLLYRAEKRWWILEPDAVLVIVLVLGSLLAVYGQ
ncbi:MAG: hypothetical protein KDA58_03020 [Planctomycetaceae bacterium]|nr:hypothetical protein [Planctomycetaceae bacterium]